MKFLEQMNSEYDTKSDILWGIKDFIEMEEFGMGQEEKGKQNIPWKGIVRTTTEKQEKHRGILKIVCFDWDIRTRMVVAGIIL